MHTLIYPRGRSISPNKNSPGVRQFPPGVPNVHEFRPGGKHLRFFLSRFFDVAKRKKRVKVQKLIQEDLDLRSSEICVVPR